MIRDEQRALRSNVSDHDDELRDRAERAERILGARDAVIETQLARETQLRAEAVVRDREIGMLQERVATLGAELDALRMRAAEADDLRFRAELQSNEIDQLRKALRSRDNELIKRATSDARLLRTDFQLIRNDVRHQLAGLNQIQQRMDRAESMRTADQKTSNDAVVRDVRAAVDAVVPRGARVLVAATGDELMLRLRGRRASHFPQGAGGRYGGCDPVSSAKAVEHLERLRAGGAEYLVLTPSTLWWLDHFDGFREHLADRTRLVHSDARCVIYDVRPRRSLLPRRRRGAGRRPARAPEPTPATKSRRVSDTEYARVRAGVRDAVSATVPERSTVLIVSKGDEDLLELGPRTAWHFPRSADGTYAGHHPSDGAAAVAALEELRSQGGEFLVIPSTSSWWLKHYAELRRHLDTNARRVPTSGDACAIYDLRGSRPVAPVATASSNGSRAAAEDKRETARTSHLASYLDAALPVDACVVVVSDATDDASDVGRRIAQRLPGDRELTAAQAVAELERLRSRGAEYLVVPKGSRWWRRQPGLRRHVEGRYVAAMRDRGCTIYSLGGRLGRRSDLKVSVLCWDMGHNPLGRAHVLADVLRGSFDVEIVGAHFERYGTKLWEPLQDSLVPMRTFRGSLFPEHFRTMEEVAERIDGDVLFVSKPRLPSFGLGLLAKAYANRPLLLDCDDHEASFFPATGGSPIDLAAHVHDSDFHNPHGAIWTRYCESITASADELTVSSHVLQSLFGGTIIPHARDEHVFDPARYDRDAVRAELGLQPDDRLILFAGTPRKHKGIGAIAAALARLGDPRYKLGVIATGDYARIRSDLGADASFVHEIGVQPFGRLPAILAAADLTCVLQDPTNVVSRYQTPAKITDAIAMGVPCIATPVPPLEPLIAQGAVVPVADAPLHELIDAVLSDPEASRRAALGRRSIFLESFSYAAVRPRLEAVVRTAAADERPMPAELDELVAFQRRVFADRKPSHGRSGERARTPRRERAVTGSDVTQRQDATNDRSPEASRARVRTPDEPPSYDIVMFWKHNDTGIYGRRQDMLVKHLAASDRVNKIVHFDAPVDLAWLRKHLKPKDAQANHSRLLARQTLGRVGVLTSRGPKLHNYTFLHGGDRRSTASKLMPARDDYVDWIASKLRRHGVGQRTSATVFWAYPRLFGFPEIADALAPDLVVADVVDDDRTWSTVGSDLHEQLTRNYEEILSRSDLVIASTEAVRDAMAPFADEIHLVPNACEPPGSSVPKTRVPRELRRLKGPIIGYVGNLSSRIDVPLLELLATNRPGWNIVLIGSAHLNRDVLRLQAYPNVHILGVKQYEDAKRYIRAFDVALIPHLDDAMTRSMHPLKAFAYAAENVPIVTTNIANLGELRGFVQVADGPWDFLWQVELAIAAGKRDTMPPALAETLARHSWTERTKTIIELLDRTVARGTSTRTPGTSAPSSLERVLT